MLVITRYRRETIHCTLPDGREIIITNLGDNRFFPRCRLGIQAPLDIKVRRGELPPRKEELVHGP